MVAVELLRRVSGKQLIHGRPKDLRQTEIDRSDGAVKIQSAKQHAARLDEVNQGVQALGVQGQAPRSEEAVVQQALQIEGANTMAAHETVAENEVHIVHG